MEKKQVGRPKLYDTSSHKIEAFRKRLESAGYMRKELLVTQETWDQVTTLAKENGVSTSDAASGLLEYGTNAFMAKQPTATIAYSRKQVPHASSDSPPVVVKPRLKTPANPISDFFNKRKESAQISASIETEKKS